LEDLTPDVSRRARPKLFIGATDVLKGERVIFTGETLTYDDLIASSAVPPIFRAVPIERPLKQGEAPASPRAPDLYWDGLFTTNPPVREFTDFENPEDRPDEIWVVQINPQERADEPRTMQEIIDRRNELAGNLSLGQELYFVDSVNKFRRTQGPLKDQYKEIVVRVVQLDAPSAYLDYPSKLDRGVAHIEALLERGRERAAWFFDDRSKWPRDDTVPAKSRYIERKPPETRQ
jgi:NTE family protein